MITFLGIRELNQGTFQTVECGRQKSFGPHSGFFRPRFRKNVCDIQHGCL